MGKLRFITSLVAALCGCLLCTQVFAAESSMESSMPGMFTYAKDSGDGDNPLLNAAGHLLAEGDYLLAQFSDGIEQEDFHLQVDSAGEVQMPLIGAVQVAGLNPKQAADALTEAYRKYYRNPYVAIQVLDLGRFEIFVFGPDFPGRTYLLPNGSDFLDMLRGLELGREGLYRRIHLIRGDVDFKAITDEAKPLLEEFEEGEGDGLITLPSPGAVSREHESLAGFVNWRKWVSERIDDPQSEVTVIDPLRITVEGELSDHNVVLQAHDVVYIPTPERFVDISGVKNPGRYELLGEETLGDILRLAGTLNYSADLQNTVIRRTDECGDMERLIFNLYPALDDPGVIECYPLQNRDVITIINREERIFVLGEVNSAGAFTFREDSTVLDYIAEAGGETPQAHLAWIAVIRQGRDRLNPQLPSEVIQANFKEIHKGLPLCQDISLLPGDVIYVPPKGFKFEMPQVIQAISTAVTGYAVVENSQNSNN
jgi:protein involved in polysaccharide export with SLBB domain